MKKAEVHALIQKIGIVPAIRVSTPEYASFAAQALNDGGIPIAEIAMNGAERLAVISHLARSFPGMIVGATVRDAEAALQCIEAGARFLTSPGFISGVVEFALKNDVVVFPGALTPTEVIAAWAAGSDFVKVFPCAPVGGASYIQSLNVSLPDVLLIASGGVNQQTAANFIRAGATALGIGVELIPKEALRDHRDSQIRELSHRFMELVKDARSRVW